MGLFPMNVGGGGTQSGLLCLATQLISRGQTMTAQVDDGVYIFSWDSGLSSAQHYNAGTTYTAANPMTTATVVTFWIFTIRNGVISSMMDIDISNITKSYNASTSTVNVTFTGTSAAYYYLFKLV